MPTALKIDPKGNLTTTRNKTVLPFRPPEIGVQRLLTHVTVHRGPILLFCSALGSLRGLFLCPLHLDRREKQERVACVRGLVANRTSKPSFNPSLAAPLALLDSCSGEVCGTKDICDCFDRKGEKHKKDKKVQRGQRLLLVAALPSSSKPGFVVPVPSPAMAPFWLHLNCTSKKPCSLSNFLESLLAKHPSLHCQRPKRRRLKA